MLAVPTTDIPTKILFFLVSLQIITFWAHLVGICTLVLSYIVYRIQTDNQATKILSNHFAPIGFRLFIF